MRSTNPYFNTKYNFINFLSTHRTTDLACVTHKKNKGIKTCAVVKIDVIIL